MNNYNTTPAEVSAVFGILLILHVNQKVECERPKSMARQFLNKFREYVIYALRIKSIKRKILGRGQQIIDSGNLPLVTHRDMSSKYYAYNYYLKPSGLYAYLFVIVSHRYTPIFSPAQSYRFFDLSASYFRG